MRITGINQNNSTRQKPSFKAKIYCLDEDTLNYLLKKSPSAYKVSDLYSSYYHLDKAAVNQPLSFTPDVCNCVAGSIFNTETKLGNLFHLNPYEENLFSVYQIRQSLIEQAEKLKAGCNKKLEGAIFGGDDIKLTGEDDNFLEIVKNIFNEISDFFGMEYSVIGGRNQKTNIKILSDAVNNTHYVNFKRYVNKSEVDIDNVDDLINTFESKIISPKDTFIIKGKDATEEFKNKTAQGLWTKENPAQLMKFA